MDEGDSFARCACSEFSEELVSRGVPGEGGFTSNVVSISGGGRLVPTVSDPHCFISFTQFLGPCVYDLLIGEGSFRVAQNNNGIAGSGEIGPVALVLVHRQLEAPHFCSSVAQLLKSHYKRAPLKE